MNKNDPIWFLGFCPLFHSYQYYSIIITNTSTLSNIYLTLLLTSTLSTYLYLQCIKTLMYSQSIKEHSLLHLFFIGFRGSDRHPYRFIFTLLFFASQEITTTVRTPVKRAHE